MSDYKTFLEENAETLATIDAKRKEGAALTSFERMIDDSRIQWRSIQSTQDAPKVLAE